MPNPNGHIPEAHIPEADIPGQHISDQDLVLAADGELSARRARRVHAHIMACPACHERMVEIETATASFTRAYRETSASEAPSMAGPRALLRARLRAPLRVPLGARLARLVSVSGGSAWHFLFGSLLARRALAICVVLFAALAGAVFYQQARRQSATETGLASSPASSPATGSATGSATGPATSPATSPANSLAASAPRTIPDANLTPGAARSVALSTVCARPDEEVVKNVPASLRQRVFKEYGIQKASAGNYEVDYLITPGLGGAGTLRNLWPEPYDSVWNAHVKDALEGRLHQLVCTHQLGLATAQHAIATDWIAAYQEYFHTDKPLMRYSGRQISALEPGDRMGMGMEKSWLEDRGPHGRGLRQPDEI